MLGAAMLGAVAAGCRASVRDAMSTMSTIGRRYEPAGGEIAALHAARFHAFIRLQAVAREIR